MIAKLSSLAGVFLLGALINCAQGAAAGITVVFVEGEFDDVKERVVQAIENRGLVIGYTVRVNDMLERTGKDLGREQQVYGKAEVIEFCSAQLSRDSMEADPRNIVFCPYAIAVYTLPREPDKVWISYRKPVAMGSGQSIKALRAVDKLLQEIVGEAMK